MAVRTAYVPVAGTAITAANHLKFPGGWIGYAEVTASQTGIGSSATDLTGLTVTVTVGTSRRILAEGCCRVTQQTSTGTHEVLVLQAGSGVGKSSITSGPATNAMHHPRAVTTPSSGSTVYKLQAATTAGTVDLVAGAGQPGFILVTDVGPSS